MRRRERESGHSPMCAEELRRRKRNAAYIRMSLGLQSLCIQSTRGGGERCTSNGKSVILSAPWVLCFLHIFVPYCTRHISSSHLSLISLSLSSSLFILIHLHPSSSSPFCLLFFIILIFALLIPILIRLCISYHIISDSRSHSHSLLTYFTYFTLLTVPTCPGRQKYLCLPRIRTPAQA